MVNSLIHQNSKQQQCFDVERLYFDATVYGIGSIRRKKNNNNA